MVATSENNRRSRLATRGGGANPLLQYVPDFLAAMIILFMPMRLFGIGPVTALIWISCAGLLIAYRRQTFARTMLHWWPLMLMPMMLFLSFIWSDAPGISARYGFQAMITCILGVFLANVLSPTRFAIAMCLGMLVFCVASVIDGRQGLSETGMVLVGLTGSKNSMAFAANMLLSASVAVLFLPGMHRVLRLLAGFGAVLGVYLVMITASVTAVILSIALVCLFVAMCVMQRFSPAARAATIIVALAVISPLAFASDEITEMVHTFMREVLHKDPVSMTGRSYFWARADELISQRPLLGYGFQAIWMGDSSDTLGLLRAAGVSDGRTFNFHHTYRQAAVDIGLIGAGMLVVALIASVIAAIRQFILTPTVATSFAFSFLMITLAKSFTELIIGAFTLQTVLLFACCTYAFWRPQTQGQPVRRPPARSAAY